MSDRVEQAPSKQFLLRHFRYNFRFSSGRSGNSHKYGDTSVETSFEMIVEAEAPMYVAIRPSSHNDCHQKNLPNIRDKTGMVRIHKTAQTPSTSIPSRSQ